MFHRKDIRNASHKNAQALQDDEESPYRLAEALSMVIALPAAMSYFSRFT
jgi:hypothetical protein